MPYCLRIDTKRFCIKNVLGANSFAHALKFSRDINYESAVRTMVVELQFRPAVVGFNNDNNFNINDNNNNDNNRPVRAMTHRRVYS